LFTSALVIKKTSSFPTPRQPPKKKKTFQHFSATKKCGEQCDMTGIVSGMHPNNVGITKMLAAGRRSASPPLFFGSSFLLLIQTQISLMIRFSLL
jgi:hypothetical protein